VAQLRASPGAFSVPACSRNQSSSRDSAVAKSARFRMRDVDLVIRHYHHQVEVHVKGCARLDLSTT
jgi:hypothetical protein